MLQPFSHRCTQTRSVAQMPLIANGRPAIVRLLGLLCLLCLLLPGLPAPTQAQKVTGSGDNSYGQSHPPTNLGPVKTLAAGTYHSLALKPDGTVTGWGSNTNGQLNVPASIQGHVVAISAGAFTVWPSKTTELLWVGA